MKTLGRYLVALTALLTVGIGIFAILPTPVTAFETVTETLRDGDLADADQLAAALAALGCWVLLGWMIATSTTTAAVAIGGKIGHLANSLTSTLAPRAVRHTLATILGVTLITGAIATGPAYAQASTPDVPRVPAQSLNLDWPTDGQAPAPLPMSPSQPGMSGQAATQGDAGEARYEQSLTPPRTSTATEQDGVTVMPGDTLWSITERTLGSDATPAQIAAQWPRWWEANREVIGEDPNVIVAGQELRAPTQPTPSEEN